MPDLIGHTDCDGPMQLQLHRDDDPDVRFPIIDDGLKLHERKQGPVSISRHAEITIPITGFGESDWLQYIDAFQDGGEIQSASILGAPLDTDGTRTGDPVPVFTGYLGAVGSTGGTNRARVRIHDPMKFLDTIAAGTRFKDATVGDVLNYVVEQFRQGQSVFTDVDVSIANPNRRVIESAGFDANPDLLSDLISDPTFEILSKKFSTNRDTLADVVSWIRKRAPVKVWFGPSQDGTGITLYATENLAVEYDLTPQSENLPKLIENGALYEARPLNTLKLKGKTGQYIDVGPFEGQVPLSGDGSYPEATATYEPLVDRYGGKLTKTGETDLTSEKGARQEAKSRLKQMLDDVSGGSMTLSLALQCRCYDRLKATPACAGVTADVGPLAYEIQRLTHTVSPSDSNIPRTEVGVSLAVDPDKITVGSTTKDAQTGGEPTNSSAVDELNFTDSVGN